MMTIPLGESTTDLSDLSDQEENPNKSDQSPKMVTENEMQQEKSRSVGSVGSVAAPVSSITIESESGLRPGIYKLYECGDYYGCKNCNLKGDKYFMNVHYCKGLKKT